MSYCHCDNLFCRCPRPQPVSYLIADGDADPKGWGIKQAIHEVATMRAQAIRARLRHPRKSYVRVMRPGKKMPAVVVAETLTCKGIGHIDAGNSTYLVHGALVLGKGLRTFAFGTSDWTMFGYGNEGSRFWEAP